MLVYLDSQDYSRLTDPRHADKADTVALLSLLLHSAEADVHRFPFSNLHVQEAIHSDPAIRHLGVGRARLMKTLSRGRVFAPFEHVLMFEVSNALRATGVFLNESVANLTIVRNDSVWWPHEAIENEGPLNFRAEMMAQFDQDMKGRNREQRRVYEKHRKLLQKQKIGDAENEIEIAAQWLNERFPSSPGLTNREFLRNFILGRADQSVFLNEIASTALELETFVGWTVDNWDKARNVAGYIKAIGYGLTEKFSKDLSILRVSESKVWPPEIRVEVDAVREKGNEAVAATFRRGMVNVGASLLIESGAFAKDVSVAEVTDLLDRHPDAPMPGIDVVQGCCKVWLTLVTALVAQPQKIQRSDMLDMFHAIYLPYVDVFRADAQFANIIRQSKTPYMQKVEYVPSKFLDRLR